jgi:colanic acid/amylovoran biosynthesis glycosyltransferase
MRTSGIGSSVHGGLGLPARRTTPRDHTRPAGAARERSALALAERAVPRLMAAPDLATLPDPGTAVGYLLNGVPDVSHQRMLDEIIGLGRSGLNVHAFVLDPSPGQALQRRPVGAAGAAVDVSSVRQFAVVPAMPPVQDPCTNIVWGVSGRDQEVVRHTTPQSHSVAQQAHWIARQVVAYRVGHIHAELASGDVANAIKALTGVGYSLAASGYERLDAGRAGSLRETVDEADFVIAPDHGSWKQLLEDVDPDAARKILRMSPGVDVDRLECQTETGRDPDSVLAVIPLTEGAGVPDLIDAMAILRRRRSVATRLTIVGEGPMEGVVRGKIDALGLGDRVTLLRHAARTRVLSLMRKHAVMALPYDARPSADSEGIPPVLLEAMAVGLPVVSTPVGGVSEVIEDGWTGRLVATHDPHWLAGALETLLDNHQVRIRIANRARLAVERRFALSQNVTVLARLFANAAARSAGGPQDPVRTEASRLPYQRRS